MLPLNISLYKGIMTKENLLTSRFEEAIQFAIQVHYDQKRKSTSIPYIAHPLGVAALVLSDGGTENEVIAALLHDAAEDQGGLETLAEIQRRFGDQVADIVFTLTDSFEDPKPDWRERKSNLLAKLASSKSDAARVALADKLDNARSILRDLTLIGDEVWERFSGKKAGSLWFLQSLIESLEHASSSYLYQEFVHTVTRIREIAGESSS